MENGKRTGKKWMKWTLRWLLCDVIRMMLYCIYIPYSTAKHGTARVLVHERALVSNKWIHIVFGFLLFSLACKYGYTLFFQKNGKKNSPVMSYSWFLWNNITIICLVFVCSAFVVHVFSALILFLWSKLVETFCHADVDRKYVCEISCFSILIFCFSLSFENNDIHTLEN